LKKVLVRHPELADTSQGKVAWKGDALTRILGEEKPGHVHGEAWSCPWSGTCAKSIDSVRLLKIRASKASRYKLLRCNKVKM
jgi:hypothetical protein